MDKGLVELGCVVDVTFDVRTVEELIVVEATVLVDVTLTGDWAPLVDEVVLPVLSVGVAVTDALLVGCIVLLVVVDVDIADAPLLEVPATPGQCR